MLSSSSTATNPATGNASATPTPQTPGRKSATPSDPDPVDEDWGPHLTAEDLAFHDRLGAITAFVGRALLFGLPALFAVGILLVPLRGTIPSAVILLIVLLGSVAVVLIAERLRGRRRRLPTGQPLIGRRALLIFGIGLGMYLMFATAIALRA